MSLHPALYLALGSLPQRRSYRHFGSQHAGAGHVLMTLLVTAIMLIVACGITYVMYKRKMK